MDVFDAAYRVAHDFRSPANGRKGLAELARVLAVNAGTLQNKVNPHQETHHLTLAEAVQITVAAGDRRILEAFASTVGCVVVPVPDQRAVSDAALLELMNRMLAEQGQFAAAFNDGLYDGRFSPGEYLRLHGEAMQFVAAVLELLGRIEGLVDEHARSRFSGRRAD